MKLQIDQFRFPVKIRTGEILFVSANAPAVIVAAVLTVPGVPGVRQVNGVLCAV